MSVVGVAKSVRRYLPAAGSGFDFQPSPHAALDYAQTRLAVWNHCYLVDFNFTADFLWLMAYGLQGRTSRSS